jgi:hypothetical protein
MWGALYLHGDVRSLSVEVEVELGCEELPDSEG